MTQTSPATTQPPADPPMSRVTARAVGYLRVSTGVQADEGFGLEVQEEQVRRLCSQRGMRLVGIYADEGVSGAKGVDERPELARALNALEEGDATILVVAKLDRLARALTVQEAVLAQAWRLGASVWTADMGEVQRDDPDDPMRTAMRQMVGVFAQLERAMITARLQSGRRFKAARGGYAYGAPPFGFRAEGAEIVPDAAEQAVVARIVGLRRQGMSLRAIAELLNGEGVPAKRGCPWHTETVRRVLQRADTPAGRLHLVERAA